MVVPTATVVINGAMGSRGPVLPDHAQSIKLGKNATGIRSRRIDVS